MATYEQQGMRGNGRGADRDREEMMDEMRWRAGERDIRGDLDRRTDREEIDRRHDWHGHGGMESRFGGGREMERGRGFERGERWGSPGERFMRGESGDVPSGGRMAPERSYGSSAPSGYGSGYGTSQYGSEYYGSSGGYGGQTRTGGYGAWGTSGARGTWGPYESGERESPTPPWRGGGYGGYGGGHYGGSYGGMGGGEADYYRPASSMGGGPSGAGSLAGSFGETAGWEPDRQRVRPGAFAAHSMLLEGQAPQRGEMRERRGWEREGTLVRDVMTRNPKTVHPDTPAREAARLMREEDTGVMPVVEEGRVIGIVTDRDLAMRIIAEGKDTNTQVRHVMSGDVHVCTSDDKLVDAVRIMGEENVRRLPVVDRDDRLKGVISMTDIAREAEMDYALQEALEQIASRRSFWSRW